MSKDDVENSNHCIEQQNKEEVTPRVAQAALEQFFINYSNLESSTLEKDNTNEENNQYNTHPGQDFSDHGETLKNEKKESTEVNDLAEDQIEKVLFTSKMNMKNENANIDCNESSHFISRNDSHTEEVDRNNEDQNGHIEQNKIRVIDVVKMPLKKENGKEFFDVEEHEEKTEKKKKNESNFFIGPELSELFLQNSLLFDENRVAKFCEENIRLNNKDIFEAVGTKPSSIFKVVDKELGKENSPLKLNSFNECVNNCSKEEIESSFTTTGGSCKNDIKIISNGISTINGFEEKEKDTAFENISKMGLIFILTVQEKFINQVKKIFCGKCIGEINIRECISTVFKDLLKLKIEKQTNELYMINFVQKLKTEFFHSRQLLLQKINEKDALIKNLNANKETLIENIKIYARDMYNMKNKEKLKFSRFQIHMHKLFFNFTEFSTQLLLKFYRLLCEKNEKLRLLIARLKLIRKTNKKNKNIKGTVTKDEVGHGCALATVFRKKVAAQVHENDIEKKTFKRDDKKGTKREKVNKKTCSNSLDMFLCMSDEGFYSDLTPMNTNKIGNRKNIKKHKTKKLKLKSQNFEQVSNARRRRRKKKKKNCNEDNRVAGCIFNTHSGGDTNTDIFISTSMNMNNSICSSIEGTDGWDTSSDENKNQISNNKGNVETNKNEIQKLKKINGKFKNKLKMCQQKYSEEVQKNKTLQFLLTTKEEEFERMKADLLEEAEVKERYYENQEREYSKEIEQLKILLEEVKLNNSYLTSRNKEYQQLIYDLTRKVDRQFLKEQELNNKVLEFNNLYEKERERNVIVLTENVKLKSVLFQNGNKNNSYMNMQLTVPTKYIKRNDTYGDFSILNFWNEKEENARDAFFYPCQDKKAHVQAPQNFEKIKRNGTRNHCSYCLRNSYEDKYNENDYKNCDNYEQYENYKNYEKYLSRMRCKKEDGEVEEEKKETDEENKKKDRNKIRRKCEELLNEKLLNNTCKQYCQHKKIYAEGLELNSSVEETYNTGDISCGGKKTILKGKDIDVKKSKVTKGKIEKEKKEPKQSLTLQIKKDILNFDEKEYKKVLNKFTKENEEIEKIKEEELYSIFMQNWKQSNNDDANCYNDEDSVDLCASFFNNLNSRGIYMSNPISISENIDDTWKGKKVKKKLSLEHNEEKTEFPIKENIIMSSESNATHILNNEKKNASKTKEGRNENLDLDINSKADCTSYKLKRLNSSVINAAEITPNQNLRRNEQRFDAEKREDFLKKSNVISSNSNSNSNRRKEIPLNGVLERVNISGCEITNKEDDDERSKNSDTNRRNVLDFSSSAGSELNGENGENGELLMTYEIYKKNREKFMHMSLKKKNEEESKHSNSNADAKNFLRNMLNSNNSNSKNCYVLKKGENQFIDNDMDFLQNADNVENANNNMHTHKNYSYSYKNYYDNNKAQGSSYEYKLNQYNNISSVTSSIGEMYNSIRQECENTDNTDSRFFFNSPRNSINICDEREQNNLVNDNVKIEESGINKLVEKCSTYHNNNDNGLAEKNGRYTISIESIETNVKTGTNEINGINGINEGIYNRNGNIKEGTNDVGNAAIFQGRNSSIVEQKGQDVKEQKYKNESANDFPCQHTVLENTVINSKEEKDLFTLNSSHEQQSDARKEIKIEEHKNEIDHQWEHENKNENGKRTSEKDNVCCYENPSENVNYAIHSIYQQSNFETSNSEHKPYEKAVYSNRNEFGNSSSSVKSRNDMSILDRPHVNTDISTNTNMNKQNHSYMNFLCLSNTVQKPEHHHLPELGCFKREEILDSIQKRRSALDKGVLSRVMRRK